MMPEQQWPQPDFYQQQQPQQQLLPQQLHPRQKLQLVAPGSAVRSHSIDAVSDSTQILAGNINEMTHVVRQNVERIGDMGANTVTQFDENIAQIGANFQNLSKRAELSVSAISLPLLYTVLALLALVAVLGILQVVLSKVDKLFFLRKQQTHSQQQQKRQIQKQRPKKQQKERLIVM